MAKTKVSERQKKALSDALLHLKDNNVEATIESITAWIHKHTTLRPSTSQNGWLWTGLNDMVEGGTLTLETGVYRLPSAASENKEGGVSVGQEARRGQAAIEGQAWPSGSATKTSSTAMKEQGSLPESAGDSRTGPSASIAPSYLLAMNPATSLLPTPSGPSISPTDAMSSKGLVNDPRSEEGNLASSPHNHGPEHIEQLQGLLSQRDQQILERDRQLLEKDHDLEEKQRQMLERERKRDQVLQEKDIEIDLLKRNGKGLGKHDEGTKTRNQDMAHNLMELQARLERKEKDLCAREAALDARTADRQENAERITEWDKKMHELRERHLEETVAQDSTCCELIHKDVNTSAECVSLRTSLDASLEIKESQDVIAKDLIAKDLIERLAEKEGLLANALDKIDSLQKQLALQERHAEDPHAQSWTTLLEKHSCQLEVQLRYQRADYKALTERLAGMTRKVEVMQMRNKELLEGNRRRALEEHVVMEDSSIIQSGSINPAETLKEGRLYAN